MEGVSDCDVTSRETEAVVTKLLVHAAVNVVELFVQILSVKVILKRRILAMARILNGFLLTQKYILI